ncbi:hypothetical protein DWW65_12215 [Coprococcus comes]|uniref:Uncharacterized protein n=2 Tax=Coprococcus comes TaxID=410072 RepID=A0A3R5XLN6_9FIRM|nr:hypothetical protein DWW65_12215 [Coprococcus comes]
MQKIMNNSFRMLHELERLENLSDEYSGALRLLSKRIRKDFWTDKTEKKLAIVLANLNDCYEVVAEYDFGLEYIIQYIKILAKYAVFIKPELKTEYYNELIDDIQIENARGIIEKQWENVLLAEDGLKSFKEIFDDIFQKCLRIHQDKFFCELEESDVICRVVNDKYPINKERFIPWDNTDTINRWNPPGKTYLYLSYTKVDEQYNSRLKLSEYICLEEYRANKGERYYFCNFRPTKKGHILNLSYNDNSLRTYKNMLINHEADLENKILEEVMNNSDIDKFQSKRKIKRAIKKAQKKYDVDKAIIEESVAKQYLKMICSCIYKKVDEIDEEKREEAYKSFWILANYLEEKGVTGIIYPCTRDRKICGKNIVLFNKYDAEPIESTIREFNY